MSATFINPKLPAQVRGLYEADLLPGSIQTMLDLAADIIQEHIDNCSAEKIAEVRAEAKAEAWAEGERAGTMTQRDFTLYRQGKITESEYEARASKRRNPYRTTNGEEND